MPNNKPEVFCRSTAPRNADLLWLWWQISSYIMDECTAKWHRWPKGSGKSCWSVGSMAPRTWCCTTQAAPKNTSPKICQKSTDSKLGIQVSGFLAESGVHLHLLSYHWLQEPPPKQSSTRGPAIAKKCLTCWHFKLWSIHTNTQTHWWDVVGPGRVKEKVRSNGFEPLNSEGCEAQPLGPPNLSFLHMGVFKHSENPLAHVETLT